MTDRIDLSGDISIPFLKKSRFTGSFRGMRYVLRKQERVVEEASEDRETVLEAVIWPEPMNFEHTPDEKKHGRDFSFDQEGLQQAVAWLNEEYASGRF